MYQFPSASLPNHQKLNQYQCIILKFSWSEAWHRSHWTEIKAFLLETRGQNSFPSFQRRPSRSGPWSSSSKGAKLHLWCSFPLHVFFSDQSQERFPFFFSSSFLFLRLEVVSLGLPGSSRIISPPPGFVSLIPSAKCLRHVREAYPEAVGFACGHFWGSLFRLLQTVTFKKES